MKTRLLLVLAMAICLVSAASAQTKASGTLDCAKPDPMHMVEVGDRPGHMLGVNKSTCKWSKPMDIGGMQSKDGSSTEMMEANGAKSTGNGFHWGTVEGGDKYTVRYNSAATMTKDGKLEAASGSWKYTSGTGKLKGLSGGGTYKCAPTADGGSTCEIEGAWSMAAAKPAAAKK